MSHTTYHQHLHYQRYMYFKIRFTTVHYYTNAFIRNTVTLYTFSVKYLYSSYMYYAIPYSYLVSVGKSFFGSK